MWTAEAIKEVLEKFKETSRTRFAEHGRLPVPMVMLHGRRHPDTMAATDMPIHLQWELDQPYGDQASKDALMIQVRLLASRTNAVGVAMAMEVWFKPLEKGETPPTGSIAEHPERQEALLIVFEPGIDALALGVDPEDALAIITRDGDGKPTLEDWVIGKFREAGAFDDLLPRPKVQQ